MSPPNPPGESPGEKEAARRPWAHRALFPSAHNLFWAGFACVSLGLAALIIEHTGRTYFDSEGFVQANGQIFGGDYLAFYVGGRLFTENREKLYDLEYQEDYRRVLLGPAAELKTSQLPFVYPPLVAALLSPFSRLSFQASFWTWMAFGLVASLSSLFLLARASDPARVTPFPLILLSSLGFVPFAVNAALGGQIAWLGIAVLALLARSIIRGNDVSAGLLMSLSYYKPPLFVFLLFVLLLSRGRRFMYGFVTGASLLVGLSIFSVGLDGVASYLSMVPNYAYGQELVPGGTVPPSYGMGLVALAFTLLGSMKQTLLILAVPFVACSLMCVRLLRTNEEKNTLLGLILGCSATIAFSLQTGKYDLALLLVPMVLALAWIGEKGNAREALPFLPLLALYFEFALRDLQIGGYSINVSSLLFVFLLTLLVFYGWLSVRPGWGDPSDRLSPESTGTSSAD